MSAFLAILAMMVVVHALLDYPLQGDFLARAKNRLAPVPGVPWYQGLAAHSIIQGGGVWFVTGAPLLGLSEALCHFVIDDLKSMGRITFNQDQALHIVCKVAWAAAVLAGV